MMAEACWFRTVSSKSLGSGEGVSWYERVPRFRYRSHCPSGSSFLSFASTRHGEKRATRYSSSEMLAPFALHGSAEPDVSHPRT